MCFNPEQISDQIDASLHNIEELINDGGVHVRIIDTCFEKTDCDQLFFVHWEEYSGKLQERHLIDVATNPKLIEIYMTLIDLWKQN